MADYYPLLVRAISGLAQNTGETRRVVYDRARAALVKQLRSVEPPLPEGEITRERLSLEDAIRRIEADMGANEAPASAAPSEPEAPRAPAPPPPRPFGAGRTEAGPASGAASPSAAPSSPASSSPAPSSPSPRPARPAEGAQEAAPDAAEAPAAEPPARREAGRRGQIQPRGEDEANAERRPSLQRGEVRGRGAVGARRNGRASGGFSWQKMVLVALVALVIAGGVAFVLMSRGSLLGGRQGPGPGSAPVPTVSAQDQPKNADRVAQSSSDAARRSAPAARPGAVGATQRAVLYEESPGGGQPQAFEGTVTWRTETVNAGPGLPPDIGVRGEIQIPERHINVSFNLRRNTDQTLPASHTIEIGFTLPADFPFGGISNVPGIRVKQTEAAQGAPLAGIAVKVNPTLYLVGLSSVPADRQRNLQLLQSRPWLDVPVVYTNNKRAIIAFEKGTAGEQAFNDAFSAWGELVQQPAGGG